MTLFLESLLRPLARLMIEAEDLSVTFAGSKVVDAVNISLRPAQGGLGLVGESGSGKTTIARALLRLVPPSSGHVLFEGRDVRRLRRAELKRFRRSVQVVFQDPNGTLDPRMRIGTSIAEVLKTHRIVSQKKNSEQVAELLGAVELPPSYATRRPHELSGGQRQRVSIARALAVKPKVLILDEPTSALDVTTQVQILNLIEALQRAYDLSFLLISHNLAIVDRLCAHVAVLYLGRVVETGPTSRVLGEPAHPYTSALLSAVPHLERGERARVLLDKPSDPQTLDRLSLGCAFHPRCPIAVEHCRNHVPPLKLSSGRLVACHRSSELAAKDSNLWHQLWRSAPVRTLSEPEIAASKRRKGSDASCSDIED